MRLALSAGLLLATLVAATNSQSSAYYGGFVAKGRRNSNPTTTTTTTTTSTPLPERAQVLPTSRPFTRLVPSNTNNQFTRRALYEEADFGPLLTLANTADETEGGFGEYEEGDGVDKMPASASYSSPASNGQSAGGYSGMAQQSYKPMQRGKTNTKPQARKGGTKGGGGYGGGQMQMPAYGGGGQMQEPSYGQEAEGGYVSF